jgi:hypothetical protein
MLQRSPRSAAPVVQQAVVDHELYPHATVAIGQRRAVTKAAKGAGIQSALWKGVTASLLLACLVVVALVLPQYVALHKVKAVRVFQKALPGRNWLLLAGRTTEENATLHFQPLEPLRTFGLFRPKRVVATPLPTVSSDFRYSTIQLLSHCVHGVVSGTRHLLQLPLMVAGLPVTVITTALEGVVHVVGFVQDKFANFGSNKTEPSSDAKSYRAMASDMALTVVAGRMRGWQLALAQWQRRVATVGEALWWWVRGGHDDYGPPHKVEPPPSPPVEEAVDWRL